MGRRRPRQLIPCPDCELSLSKEITKFPDPRLSLPTEKITNFDNRLKRLSFRMLKIMYATHGVGLAANQIGLSKSIFVYDDHQGNTGTICNPTFISLSQQEQMLEGCLSIPSYRFEIPRFGSVLLRGQNLSGSTIEIEAQGLLAQIFQHETDHLKGRLYISYLPRETQRAILLATEENKNVLGEKEGRL